MISISVEISKRKKEKKHKIHADCSVVVVAGGSSERFGADKLASLLAGTPVLAYSLAIFQSCEYVKEIVLVVADGKIESAAELVHKYGLSKVSKVVLGGATRLESALSGVSECDPSSRLIAVHDGARPLASQKVISAAIEMAYTKRAVVPAVQARDTIKLAENGAVTSTPERESAFLIQTPQVFEPVIIKGALTNALEKGLQISDDAQAVEALGFTVYLSQGSEENIKITTPQDLLLAEAILSFRRASAEAGRAL
jgi:2-C-methyl-D-erythritol 4-phosphate cytidylyltransferase